jgi:hypothetical protein
MAGPITWRTINGPDPAAALAPMVAAQRSIDGAFDTFQRVIQQREAFQGQQAAAVREGNKQAFLDALQGARTPEEVEALRASGQLDALAARLTPENRAAVRGADEARLMGTRQLLQSGQAFEETQMVRAQKPIVDQVSTLLAAGKVDESQALLDQNPNLLGRALLQNSITQARRNKTLLEREDRDDSWKVDDRNTRKQLTELEIKERTRLANETEQNRNFDSVLATERSRFQDERGRVLKTQGELAQADGLPVTKEGFPDFANWNQAQVNQFDELARQAGLPTSAATTTGDSALAQGLAQRLTADGRFSLPFIQNNMNRITDVFRSVSAPLAGNDAENAARAAAQTQVALEVDNQNSWYAPGSPNAYNSYKELPKIVDEIVERRNGWWGDKADQKQYINAALRSMAVKGIPVNDENGKPMLNSRGEPLTVVPSVNDVISLLESVDTVGFTDEAFAENFKNKMIDWVNSSEGRAKIMRSLTNQEVANKTRATQLFRENMNPTKK